MVSTTLPRPRGASWPREARADYGSGMRRCLILVVLLVAGCGSGRPHTTHVHPAVSNSFTPAERHAIALQRHKQRAQFSSAAVNSRLARLHGPARRRAVVLAVERAILSDARQRYRAHELDKRARSVACSVEPDDKSLLKRNPDAPVVRYSCLAITFRAGTTLVGIDFVARVNLAKPGFAWCLFVPVGGEGAHAAATLAAPPPASCIADPPR